MTNHIDDAQSFGPLHGLGAYQPLGEIDGVRRETYDCSADCRGIVNGCPMTEPRLLADLP